MNTALEKYIREGHKYRDSPMAVIMYERERCADIVARAWGRDDVTVEDVVHSIIYGEKK